MCVQNKEKNRTPEGFFTVYTETTERIGWLFGGDRIVVSEELKRPVGDAIHCGRPGSLKMLAGNSIFWWCGMEKDNKTKCSTCTANMSSGKKLKYRLRSTEKIKLLALAQPGQEIQINFASKLHNKHKTSGPYILKGIDRYSKWPVVWICKSIQAKVVKFFGNFINLYGVPEKMNFDGGSSFIS